LKGSEMKKSNKSKCTCNKQKPMTIYMAACQVVNTFIEEVNKLSSIGFLKKETFAVMHEENLVASIVKKTFGTIDGKKDDLERVEKLANYIIGYHIEKGDICSISHVKVKNYENGQQGWTSIHPEGIPA